MYTSEALAREAEEIESRHVDDGTCFVTSLAIHAKTIQDSVHDDDDDEEEEEEEDDDDYEDGHEVIVVPDDD